MHRSGSLFKAAAASTAAGAGALAAGTMEHDGRIGRLSVEMLGGERG